MIDYLPGYFQMRNRHYFQGVMIFVITLLSVLSLLRLTLFPSPYQDKDLILALIVGVFFSGIIWHLLSIVHIKAGMPPRSESPEMLYEKARLSMLKQNFALAEIHLNKLLKLKPGDEDGMYQLGRVYLELGKRKEALAVFEKYLSGKGKKWRQEVEDLYEETPKK